MPGAAEIAVDSLERISGGASRETYRFRLTWLQDGAARERKLILRRDPPASLIDTERRRISVSLVWTPGFSRAVLTGQQAFPRQTQPNETRGG